MRNFRTSMAINLSEFNNFRWSGNVDVAFRSCINIILVKMSWWWDFARAHHRLESYTSLVSYLPRRQSSLENKHKSAAGNLVTEVWSHRAMVTQSQSHGNTESQSHGNHGQPTEPWQHRVMATSSQDHGQHRAMATGPKWSTHRAMATGPKSWSGHRTRASKSWSGHRTMPTVMVKSGDWALAT